MKKNNKRNFFNFFLYGVSMPAHNAVLAMNQSLKQTSCSLENNNKTIYMYLTDYEIVYKYFMFKQEFCFVRINFKEPSMANHTLKSSATRVFQEHIEQVLSINRLMHVLMFYISYGFRSC